MPCATHANQPPVFHDYFSSNLYTWCTNCGNYGIHAAVKRALVAEGVTPCDSLLCFDIGCHGNGSDKISGYRYHGLHGRIISFACGAAVANQRLTVMAFAGDGGTLGEGIGHLIHGIRGNYDITFILHNNLNYGLTQGQASSTTKPCVPMTAAPDGITSDPIHPMRFVLSLEPSFAARTFSGDIHHMTKTIQAGIRHKGFSFIEILQNCPTYNKSTPHEWYQTRVVDLEQKTDYDSSNIQQARAIAEDLENQIALGVIFQKPDALPFMKRQANRQEFTTELIDEVKPFDVSELFNQFR